MPDIKWKKPSGVEIVTNDLDATIDMAASLGWELVKDSKPMDGDKGHGKPGTMRWHEVQINAMNDKSEVAQYVKSVTSQDIDKRGGLDIVKEKATQALESYSRG